MSQYANWYSVELNGYLKGRMSEVDRFEAVKEIMSHLAEHVDDLILKGMDPIQAEKAAIASFGAPRDAALNLINQGPRWRFGGAFYTLSALSFCVGVVVTAITFRALSLRLSYAYNLSYGLSGVAVATLALALLGGLFSRKSDLKKLAFGWVAGMAIAGGVLVFGPQPNFANVPPDKFPAQLALWKQGLEATKKLGSIENELKSSFASQFENGYYQVAPKDRVKALEAIKKIAPQLLQVKPSYVMLTGKSTSGYLVPTSRNGMNSYYYRSRYGYPTQSGSFNPPTGECMPWTYMNLAYEESADKALDAWAQQLSDYGNNEFTVITNSQEAFIINAEMISKKSVGEMAIGTLSPLAGSSLLFMLVAYVVGLLASKLPSLTFYTTFRRRLA